MTTAAAYCVIFSDSTVTLQCLREGSERKADAQAMFNAVKRLLNRRGFALGPVPNVWQHYRCLSGARRYGCAGELEVEVRREPSGVTVEFYQNVYNVANRNGGQHDFDKLKRMPYLLRQRTRLAMHKLAAMAVSEFGVTDLRFPRPPIGPEGISGHDAIVQRIRGSGHYVPALGRADWGAACNRRSGDGALLEHESEVYFRDTKGRWRRGVAYYSLNNTWFVLSGRYAVRQLACSSLFVGKPDDLRSKEDHGQARLEVLLHQAVSAKAYDRVRALAGALAWRDRQVAASPA